MLQSPQRLPGRRWWHLAGVLVLLGYSLLLGATWRPAIVGPDDHGYVRQGTTLALDGRFWFTLDSPIQYVGRHWLVDSTGRYLSRYSPGIGGLVATTTLATDVGTSLAVNAVLTVLTLAGLGVLVGSRRGAGWGSLAMVLLGLSPGFTGHSMLLGSSMAVACLVVWGGHFLLRWRERGGAPRAFLAGLLLGLIPLFRPAEAILGLGAAALLLLTIRAGVRPWREAALAVTGAILGVIPLLAYNHEFFGEITRTGYSVTGVQSAFGLRYLMGNLGFYAALLPRDGLGLVTILAIPGLVALFRDRTTRAMGAMFTLMIGAQLSVYLVFHYLPTPTPSLSVRFLVPSLPLLAAAAVFWLAKSTIAWTPLARALAVGSLLAVQVSWGVWGGVPIMQRLVSEKEWAATAHGLVAAHVPPGGVVFSPDELLLVNLDIHRRWRVADRLVSLDSTANAVLDGTVRSRGLSKQVGKRALQTRHFDGLSTYARDSLFAADAERWAGDAGVYYVGPASGFNQPSSSLFDPETFEVLADSVLPGSNRARQVRLVLARWNPPASRQ